MKKKFKSDRPLRAATCSPLFALRYYVDPPRWFEKWAAIGPCFTADPAKAASFPSHDEAMRESGKFPVMCPTDVVPHPVENAKHTHEAGEKDV